MKNTKLILSICILYVGCNSDYTDSELTKTNAYLKNNVLVFQPNENKSEIRLKAKFKEHIEIKKRKKGNWYHYLYKIVYDNVEVLNGNWDDLEISFLCKDLWPTEESGIMLKKAAWPFQKNQSLIFEIEQKDNKYLIIGYYKPTE